MDSLNKAFAQLIDLFRSMTPGARITTALLLVVVVVSVGYLFTYHGTSADVYLMNGAQFTASQSSAMEAAFAKANLNTYQYDGTRIRVPHSQQNAYMAALAENNALPENYSKILDDALANTNPWIDRQQREQMVKAAKQKQLESILRAMPGIQNAFVMYDVETRRGFNKENVGTASVNVMPLGGQPLPDAKVLAIRTLVARAIAGLQMENVAVTDLSSGRTLVGNSGDSLGSPLEDPYSSRKQMYERDWREKILGALSYVPGVTVSVNVELDRDKIRRKETVQHDPKVVASSVTEKSRTSTSEAGGSGGGRPGYAAQQPNTALQLAANGERGNSEQQEESESQTTNAISGTRETVENVGLTPTRATVSVGVPISYFQQVWSQRNPASAGTAPKPPDQAALDQIRTEETTKIRDHVAKLLPAVENVKDPTQLVQVTTFQDIKSPDLPSPGTSDYVVNWLVQNWSTLGMVVLAVVGLMMLRSLVRLVPAPAGPLTAAAAPGGEAVAVPAAAEEREEPAEVAAQHRLRRFSGGGPTLRDELSELVKEDPDAAANVLRAWIGSGPGAKT